MQEVKEKIISFLNSQSESSGTKGYVVGVSGGIDSAVVSTLCAMTGRDTTLIVMPIEKKADSNDNRALNHCNDLIARFPNVKMYHVDLTDTFKTMVGTVSDTDLKSNSGFDLALVNTRSRLRMSTLYLFANAEGKLVVGTGNKVEDYGIGFFTKYGDGGVDISPIGDLYKSQVYELGSYIGVREDILQAKPTDGLWDDNRTDEDQIGATYADLEWCMEYEKQFGFDSINIPNAKAKAWDIYVKRHNANAHKMCMPPICLI